MGIWDSYPLVFDHFFVAVVQFMVPQVGAQRLKETETVVDKLKAGSGLPSKRLQFRDGSGKSMKILSDTTINDKDIVGMYNSLVGGLEHFLFSIIYGMSSFPLTNILQRG
jgi:predicted TPR repeat methyltransferase